MQTKDFEKLIQSHTITVDDKYYYFVCSECGSTTQKTISGLLHSKSKPFIDICPQCLKKRSCIEKYGFDNAAKSPIIQQKMRKTCLERYGAENIFGSDIGKERISQTIQKKYNKKYYLETDEALKRRTESNLMKYGVENVSQLQSIKDKVAATCEKLYGAKSALSSKECRDKAKKTCVEKYGYEYASQSPEIRLKVEQTSVERYGTKCVLQSQIVKEKIKKTNLQRYGVENPGQRPEQRQQSSKRWKLYAQENAKELRQKCAKKYYEEDVSFDSSWELAYFIYLRDHNIEFEYQCDPIEYIDYDGKKRFYFPDFKVEGQLIEIKGDHFFENEKFVNPFDRSIEMDLHCQKKYECMIANHVKILKSADMQKYLKYVHDTYGHDYLLKCRLD